ncbi:hypothetical protein HXY32_06340 [Candidatus Bathyarchaeota archaeon]|nr:hypothetical protein [Candidatus Bathyarchaeota archaeon]
MPGVNGGIYKGESREFKTLNYIAVESVGEYVKKIKALGAESLFQNRKSQT